MLNSIVTELVDYAEICPPEVNNNPAIVILGTIFILVNVVVKVIFG